MAKITKTWNKKYKTREGNFDMGGNGVVSKITDNETERQKLVIKELSNNCFTEEKKARFIEEIKIMSMNYKKIDGIMPVYDYSMQEYWYVMPEAELLLNYIKEQNIDFDKRIDLIIAFTKILKILHDNQIAHRDIKPLNLYILDNKPYFGDFGLVDFPDKGDDFTKSDKGLGAIFTIAPEMKRNPKHADGKKADVYSFAKTVWMILTLDEKGFDGQYNRNDSVMSISKMEKYRNTHLKELEDLLSRATDNNPDNRPTAEQFLNELNSYKRIKEHYLDSQLSDWKDISNQIFGDNEPLNCCWDNIDKIINVLNIIGKNPAYNHMFYSSTGGLDFEYAKKAAEEGCIEIYTGGSEPDIVKPKQLIFQGFGEDYSWNYFLLELSELKPIEPFRWDEDYEVLVEDVPAHYVSSAYYQYGVYDYDSGEKLPDGWKLVRRYKKGKMLITLKRGGYNSITSVYDGRHAACSAEEFKEYIQKMIKVEKLAKEKKYDPASVLDYVFRKNPFEERLPEKKHENKLITKPSGREYIKNNYSEWSIDLETFYNEIDSNIRFKIVFDEDGGQLIFSQLLAKKQEIVLSKCGTLRKNLNPNEIMWLYKREDAIALETSLNSLIKEKCEANGYVFPEYSSYITIEKEKCKNPNYLFTYSELVDELKKADDRHWNTVVINEDGRVCIVEENEYLYPVRNETFQPGNNYVGKYADVEGVANDLYPTLLGCWLEYLKTGRSSYIDYYEYSACDVDRLKKEIKTIMSQNKTK